MQLCPNRGAAVLLPSDCLCRARRGTFSSRPFTCGLHSRRKKLPTNGERGVVQLVPNRAVLYFFPSGLFLCGRASAGSPCSLRPFACGLHFRKESNAYN